MNLMSKFRRVRGLKDRCVIDAHVSEDGPWVALIGNEMMESAIFCGNEIELSIRYEFPKVCVLDENSFLIFAPRAEDEQLNCTLVFIDASKEPISFHIGDAVQDVVVTESYIVFTYFDEGAGSNHPISGEGVSVFNWQGEFQFGYSSKIGRAAVRIFDCYAACHVNRDEIAFCAYTGDGFSLVKWDIEHNTQMLVEVPSALFGPSAISVNRDAWFFYSTHKFKNTIVCYKRKRITDCGEWEGVLKSLSEGKFLELRSDGFSVIKGKMGSGL